jgi:hypothetical protein
VVFERGLTVDYISMLHLAKMFNLFKNWSQKGLKNYNSSSNSCTKPSPFLETIEYNWDFSRMIKYWNGLLKESFCGAGVICELWKNVNDKKIYITCEPNFCEPKLCGLKKIGS